MLARLFGGRLNRKHYILGMLLFAVLGFFLIPITLSFLLASINTFTLFNPGLPLIVVAAILFIPCLSLTARRLHDLGHSGWFAPPVIVPFLNVLPDMLYGGLLVGGILFLILDFASFLFLLYLAVWKGNVAINKYGAPDAGRSIWRALLNKS